MTFIAKKSGANFWQDHMACWERRGLSRKAYCEKEGINPSTFSSWCKGLSLKKTESINFVAVESSPHEEKRATNSVLQLLLPNGVRIGIGDEANEQLIKHVLFFAGSL